MSASRGLLRKALHSGKSGNVFASNEWKMTWKRAVATTVNGEIRYSVPDTPFAMRRYSRKDSCWRLNPSTPSAVRGAATGLKRRQISTNQDHYNRIGLFSIPGLVYPQDFPRLADEAIKTSDGLRQDVASMLQQLKNQPQNAENSSNSKKLVTVTTKSQALDVLYTLDQISKTICNVIDAAELCRSAHSSKEWRETAQRTFTLLQEYIATLNGDQTLYNSLVSVTSNIEIFNQLSDEEQRFATLLQREFELDGIHLPDEQRDHTRQLHGHVTTLETLFASNITNHSNKQYVLDSDLVEKVIPKPVLVQHGAIYTTYGDEKKSMVQLTTESPLSHSITTYASDSELRKSVYIERMTSCPENLEVLDALIRTRHESATALGFTSYADRFLQDKMARTPSNVMKFLNQLHDSIQPRYRQEMNILQKAKQHIEGEGSSSIEPWDVKFYTTILKNQQQQQLSGEGTNGTIDQAALAPYLSLSNCLNAMQFLVQKLFGIQMKEEALDDFERWDGVESSNPRSVTTPKEEQIHKFVFVEEATGRGLGTMYLDLHPRQGKYTHAAHFTVRGGCVVDGPQSDYQLPIVALVCNMNTGTASFSSHQEVETLYHEFGHALHSLLSRTSFQHVSGTRAAMDFVETPSHWMELFAWDEEFLPYLAIHSQTKEPIPAEYIQYLCRSRDQFRCVELQNQIVLAMFDQEIFNTPPPPHQSQKTMDTWASMHRQNAVPYAEGTHWYSNVGHLVTYGAGYYGYLYSQVFANDIWTSLFKGHSLNRQSGELIWKKLLIHGGAKDANVMLHDLLGREPTAKHVLKGIS